ncbi:MAG: peptidoglycan editing factor PgeF [Chryseolinea sp.]
MKQVNQGGLKLWEFDSFAGEEGITHFVTDRDSGNDGIAFTLSYSSTPDKAAVARNRKRVAESMGTTEDRFFLPSQVHKTRIVHVTSSTTKAELLETDALITNEKGICIAVMSADCVPILLYDKKNSAVAAVHSGWRGTVARILEKTLAEMHLRYGTIGQDIIAAIGPSVSQESYEVGGEVVEEINKAFGEGSGLLIPVAPPKAKLDLWKANVIQLKAFGLLPEMIEVSNLCTVINNDHFFSARKGDNGRFAAGIMITN